MIGHFADAAAQARFDDAYARALARLPEPAAVHDVPTAFGRVRVRRFGTDGRVPLLLLPGRSGSTAMWEPNLAAWAAERSVHAVDVLGEAGSSVQERPIRDADDQAAWLAATLSGLGLERAHLVGASFGGWLAVNLALRDTRAIASLSLIDPACVFGRIPVRMVLASLAALPASPEWLRDRMLSWISGGVPVDDEPIARLIATAMREYRLGVPPPAYPRDDALRGLHVPTLALIAGRSRVHHAPRALARARLLPDVQAELWPAASHAISGERAREVNARVLEFVTGVEGR
ncbi:alpha/beta fold hydrolase [Pseudonocardia kunmingensis]|uniref:Pimeloyl-ACP methyl ester carboxylesterase n=1 Tax=Pseudonocardia kunmingensis TaxID=630975 RepID=A0A543DJW9_9PSEU|nr:alpha/beta fold hydrolase [Pseudonocardia kunmingensis]TQM09626.1 pimeloyl-ACP methyl ester carboxylesterase [Pseudonocardia kunmingensis]